MKPFLDEHFLLQTETAKYLFHAHAKDLPIIDYHNHLPPAEIAQNKTFETLSEVWLKGDHYKWRAMRTHGIDEDFITGNHTSDWQKFEKWAETVPFTMRNPLFHWTHLELQRYFGINQLLTPQTAKDIFDNASALLKTPEFSARGLLSKMKVEVVCSTDDPIDSLEHHLQYAKSDAAIHNFKLLPTFRPDKAMNADNPAEFKEYVDALEKVVNGEIRGLGQYIDALKNRHDYFDRMGCKLSDHGLETIYAEDFTLKEVESIFYNVRRGDKVSEQDNLKFKSCMLQTFAFMDAEKGWTQQFHLGAIRNNSSRLLKRIGADCGADSIGDFNIARNMAKFFNRLDSEGRLAKTIIYNLNPAWNEVFATMIGNFQDGSLRGKMQFGSSWWFLDQKQGIENQLNALSNMGLLSSFVGMLTDSRSFLSFPRHEYFRRILCNLIGNDVENGELPNDTQWLGQMVENISYHNAKSYFNFTNIS